MKKEHVLVIKFAVLVFVVFTGQALTFTLILPYLEFMGFDVMGQMLITALGAVLTIIGQFVVGFLCDKFKTDKKVFNIALIIFAVVTWLLYSFNANPLFMIAFWTTLLSAFFMITQGVLDSWIIESDKYCLENYGLIRAFGAFGWAVGSYLTSKIYGKWGYPALGNIFLIFTIVVLLVSYFVADAKKVDTKEKLVLADVFQLALNRDFVVFTLVFLFINIVSWTDGLTTILKISELGKILQLSDIEVNNFTTLKYAVQALCELPLFFAGGWLVKKIGPVRIVIFATIVLSLRFILYGLAATPQQLVWASSLQMLTFPLIMICTKILIDKASPDNLKASGQLTSAAIYGGVSSLATPLLCGWLGGMFSNNFVLFGAAALCAVPVTLLLLFGKNVKMES